MARSKIFIMSLHYIWHSRYIHSSGQSLIDQEAESRCVGVWVLHITETSLVLFYESENNGVICAGRFVFVTSTHTSKVYFCWTSPLRL